jgi:hypothetical protein
MWLLEIQQFFLLGPRLIARLRAPATAVQPGDLANGHLVLVRRSTGQPV